MDKSLDQLTPVTPAMGGRRSKYRQGIAQTFAALKYPAYRLWFFGQMVSLVGTWMQTTAQGFFVYELTHSPVYLGYVGFAYGVPAWLFSLYGGLVADRMPRRTLLVITQTSMMVLAFILAGLTALGWVQPWHIIVLAFFLGIANAFDAPVRLAFVLEMVDREDLTNAIALNSTMFNVATAFGPAVGGITYAIFGPAWCFTINGLSFIVVIAALLAMKLKPIALRARRDPALMEIRDGLRYVVSRRAIRVIIINLMVVSLFGIGFTSLFPAWAVKVLGGDETTNGFLQSARGVGALLGALMIAYLGSFRGRGRLLVAGAFAFPALILVFTLIRHVPLALLVLVGVGLGQMVMMNTSNALVQLETPDEMRGRVMSIYTMGFFGSMPIGNLLAGVAAAWLGEPLTGALGAVVMLAGAAYMWLRVPEVRNWGLEPEARPLDRGTDMD
jgi:MFS family permease